MAGVLPAAATVCLVLGLLAAACVLLRTRQVTLALGVLLDFLLAAGLLRLSHDATTRELATAATIVVVRKVVTVVAITARRAGARHPAAGGHMRAVGGS